MAFIVIETCDDGSFDDVALRGSYETATDARQAMLQMYEHRRTHPIYSDITEYECSEYAEDYACCGDDFAPQLHEWYVWNTDEPFQLIYDEED